MCARAACHAGCNKQTRAVVPLFLSLDVIHAEVLKLYRVRRNGLDVLLHDGETGGEEFHFNIWALWKDRQEEL